MAHIHAALMRQYAEDAADDKPRTIRIGEFNVPEPMRVAPKLGTNYYTVDIRCDCSPERLAELRKMAAELEDK